MKKLEAIDENVYEMAKSKVTKRRDIVRRYQYCIEAKMCPVCGKENCLSWGKLENFWVKNRAETPVLIKVEEELKGFESFMFCKECKTGFRKCTSLSMDRDIFILENATEHRCFVEVGESDDKEKKEAHTPVEEKMVPVELIEETVKKLMPSILVDVRAAMVAMAAEAVRKLAPTAVVEDYEKDGFTRSRMRKDDEVKTLRPKVRIEIKETILEKILNELTAIKGLLAVEMYSQKLNKMIKTKP